ncbi:hypothetical protein [Amycolatopsis sp. CA-126428]|uniref:hypothetical protein n=1 Tax=Amycolatopsis sp. CA-126428 TaxID=2073158 RepID=UPI0011B0D3FE|nr:hypothetical protein [Amycolatopsis sp. CA-126428]
MTRKIPVPPDFVDAYNKGATYGELRAKYGFTAPVISRMIAELGLERHSGAPKCKPLPVIGGIDDEYNKGATLQELSNKYEVSVRLVRKILTAKNVTFRKRGQSLKTPPKLQPDVEHKIKSDYRAVGMSIRKLADKYGISYRIVRRILQSDPTITIPPPGNQSKPIVPIRGIEWEYAKGASILSLAQKYHRKQETIRSMLVMLDVEIRRQGRSDRSD